MNPNTLPLEIRIQEGRTRINDQCWLLRTDDVVVVFAMGVPLLSYAVDDVASSRLAIVQLVQSGRATREEVARGFGVKRATVHRLERKFKDGGAAALVPKKRGPRGAHKLGGEREKTVLKLRAAGVSNREIARRLGVTETAIRALLKRCGYTSPKAEQRELAVPAEGQEPDACLKAVEELPGAVAEQAEKAEEGASLAVEVVTEEAVPVQESTAAPNETPVVQEDAVSQDVWDGFTLDTDPSLRAMDRMLARMGLLTDAAPLFEKAENVQGLGVLLAVPILVAQGFFDDAVRTFRCLGSAFYGVRNTVLTLVVCFLRGINRPENLKEHSPPALGRVLGLDRAPEMKTLRRKIRELALQNRVVDFMRHQARRHLSRIESDLLWVYVDGHVSVYSGKRKLSKHHVTRLRISLPSVLDYWLNDQNGDPVLVWSGEGKSRGLRKLLPEAVRELRSLGEKRPITLVFDREGWSPELFAELDGMEGVRFLTYRKAHPRRGLPKVPEREFETCKGTLDGERVSYELADRRIYIEYGRGKKKKRLVLRQVTCLTETGHQTHVVTNDLDTPAVELAHRMFGRWTQENFFKYMKEQKDFDGLVRYLMEDADAERLVANPQREALSREIKADLAALQSLEAEYGNLALNNPEGSRRTMRGFKIAHGRLAGQIRALKEKIAKAEERLRQLPAKVPLKDITGTEPPKQVHTETRRLVHAFRMCALRAETALRELMRSEHPRWREESRTLVRTFLNASGDMEVRDGTLLVTLHEQSAPHRTRLLAHLCNEINTLGASFPGSKLVLRFRVRGEENGSADG